MPCPIMTSIQLTSANISSPLRKKTAAVAEQIDGGLQFGGIDMSRHCRQNARVVALRGVVVQHQEIADAVELERQLRVVAVDQHVADALRGNRFSSLEIPDCTRWMLVDSSGSMKPLDRPSATTLRFQHFMRRPVVKRSGSRIGRAAPSRFASSVAAASSSLMCWLEYT